jgi:hypothetical protein
VVTPDAISPSLPAPFLAFDADPSTFTAPNTFPDSAVPAFSQWPFEAVSGCAYSPEVPTLAAPSPLSADYLNSGHFSLGQNYPNSHQGETTVPFTLFYAADIHLELLDQKGRKVAGVLRQGASAGRHTIQLNLRGLGLPAGDYTYQMQISTRYGIYQQRKTMTLK